jgi:hypothetical protein
MHTIAQDALVTLPIDPGAMGNELAGNQSPNGCRETILKMHKMLVSQYLRNQPRDSALEITTPRPTRIVSNQLIWTHWR